MGNGLNLDLLLLGVLLVLHFVLTIFSPAEAAARKDLIAVEPCRRLLLTSSLFADLLRALLVELVGD